MAIEIRTREAIIGGEKVRIGQMKWTKIEWGRVAVRGVLRGGHEGNAMYERGVVGARGSRGEMSGDVRNQTQFG